MGFGQKIKGIGRARSGRDHDRAGLGDSGDCRCDGDEVVAPCCPPVDRQPGRIVQAIRVHRRVGRNDRTVGQTLGAQPSGDGGADPACFRNPAD